MKAIILVSVMALLASASPAPRSAPVLPTLAVVAPARDTARIHLGPAEGGTDAFVAWPAGRGEAPAIIVIHEWWGLNAQIRGVARRLAQEGYVAIVPDLYHGRVAGDAEMAHELSRGLDEERALGDLAAAVTWLRGQPRVGRSRIGAVGFCMGGRLSQLYALRGNALSAAVMYYGRPETDAKAISALRIPLQGHFGGDDQGIGPDQIEALRAALAKAGRSSEIYVYPGAGHAFMHEGRPSHRPDAARQAWARMLQFFQKHLKG